jgi:hypothetical protein
MQYTPAVLVAQAKEVRDDGSNIEQLLTDFEADVTDWG